MRENMEYNFNLLKKRVLESLDKSDLENIRYMLSMIKNSTLVSGVGGSNVVSTFMSKVLESKNGIISSSITPRDMLYKNLSLYRNIVSCSYSGNNYGVDVSFDNELNKYLFSTLRRDGVNNLTYYLDKEDSFISLSTTLAPMAILLSYYLDGDDKIIWEILDMGCNGLVSNKGFYEVISGHETSTASRYMESTFTEAGLGIITVHDKYDYCHGRSTIGYKNDSLTIYYNNKKELDDLIIRLLKENDKEVYVIDKISDDDIINDFYFTYISMLVSKLIAMSKGVDLSRVDYNRNIVKKVYRFRGEM